jgi:hypothetical protein
MIRNHVVRSLLFAPLLCLPLLTPAQGLYISSGANLVVTGNANMVLTNCDLHQNGTFTPGTGTVKFAGSTANSTISGSNIGFYDLAVDEPTNDIVLNNNVSVSTNLNMVSHHIELNGNNIDLGTTGMIMGESNTSYITGLTGGRVLRRATLNAPTAANPGNIGIAITTPGNLGSTLVSRGHQQQTGTTSGLGIARYFDIIPSGTNAGLNATLAFSYLDDELIGFNEADLSMSARDVPMGYWNLLGVDVLDQPNNILTKNGIDTLGRFTLTSSANNTLPIMLLSFYGKLENRQAVLNWEVANELGIMKYDIEKSADALSFTKLSEVVAQGARTNIKYSHSDPEPFKGSTYYRLKLYDNTAKGSYSRSVRVDMNEAYTLSVYPNPVTDKVNIEFNCAELKPLNFQLMDAAGRIIAIKEVMPSPGSNKVEWNISSLPSATYYIQLHGVSETPIKISKF